MVWCTIVIMKVYWTWHRNMRISLCDCLKRSFRRNVTNHSIQTFNVCIFYMKMFRVATKSGRNMELEKISRICFLCNLKTRNLNSKWG